MKISNKLSFINTTDVIDQSQPISIQLWKFKSRFHFKRKAVLSKFQAVGVLKAITD